MTVTILLADDHPIFRRGLFEIIEEASNFYVIAEAEDGEQALEALRDKQPDIAILDIAMPKIGGLDIIVKTNHWAKRPIFVLVTMYDDEAYLRRALELGALGYLLKDNVENELIACLNDVSLDKHFISPGISRSSTKSPVTAENPPS